MAHPLTSTKPRTVPSATGGAVETQVTQRATDALVRELGVIDTLKRLGQFRVGSGDYTIQRQTLFDGMSVQDLAAQIKAQRAKVGG